jgi:hypothetical protein
MKSTLRAGVFDGKEYIGEALQYNNTYIGTILEIVSMVEFIATGNAQVLKGTGAFQTKKM